MNIKRVFLLSVVSTLLTTGCQNTQQVRQNRVYDPTVIKSNELPILVGNQETERSYRQVRQSETWFWTRLKNDTYLPGENLVIQVLGEAPLEQPPSMFAFTIPEKLGTLSMNPLGPFQFWTDTKKSGERCLSARQNAKRSGQWISIFTRYCTSNPNQDLTWIENYKPSILLEKY